MNERLLDLYKIAVDEYRFQVKLNWDRTDHLTLNSGLLAIAVGLLKVGSAPVVNFFVAGVFLIGLLASVIGIQTIRKGQPILSTHGRKKDVAGRSARPD